MTVGAISAGAAYAAFPSVVAQKAVRSLPAEGAGSAAEPKPAQELAAAPGQADKSAAQAEPKSAQAESKSAKTPGQRAELTPEQLAQIAKLQARDREVRQHEAAHLAASGGLATSGASFSYQKGPDGVNYAVGGEVGINTSPGRTPAETIARARTIQAAALAPADPSGADRAVAAAAQQMEIQARAEQAQQANADVKPERKSDDTVAKPQGEQASPATPEARRASAQAVQAVQAYTAAGQPSAAGLSVFA